MLAQKAPSNYQIGIIRLSIILIWAAFGGIGLAFVSTKFGYSTLSFMVRWVLAVGGLLILGYGLLNKIKD